MLDGRGYEVVAMTGKADKEEYLKSIGAHSILLRDDIDLGKRPMEKAQWAGAVDNLGGDYLTWLTRTMDYGGNIASIGLAASPALKTTVLPFILRAVCLLGINSVDTPRDLRLAVWSRIGGDLKPRHLDTISDRSSPSQPLKRPRRFPLPPGATSATSLRPARRAGDAAGRNGSRGDPSGAFRQLSERADRPLQDR